MATALVLVPSRACGRAATTRARLPRENLLVFRGEDGAPQPVKIDRRLAEATGRDPPGDAGRDGHAPRAREAVPARRQGRGGGGLRELRPPPHHLRLRARLARAGLPPDPQGGAPRGGGEGARRPLPPRHRQRRRARRRRRPGDEAQPRLCQRARRARLRDARAELSAAGEVSARPQGARLGERDAQGRLGQHPRARPAGVAPLREARRVRGDRPFARRAQLGLHRRLRRPHQGRRVELRARLVPRLLRGDRQGLAARARLDPDPLHAQAGRLSRPARGDPLRLPRADRRPRPATRAHHRPAPRQQLPRGQRRPHRRRRPARSSPSTATPNGCASSTPTASTTSRRRCARRPTPCSTPSCAEARPWS